ncbi:MAG TPA: NUDIX domain-containing protein [Mycobacteriales bacterium]
MPLRRRPEYRAVLVDSAYRVLLLHVTDGTSRWWEAPGEVAERGETPEHTLLRALRDEAAVASGVRAGPCVWLRAGRRETRWHVAWLDDPNAPGAAPVTRTTLGARWWTLDELASSGETFRPERLPALVPAVVRGEYGAPVSV